MSEMQQASLAYKTKQIIKKYDFAFKKNFGQNFLVDERVLNKIIDAADISSEDVVLEIGPGIGTLTQALAKKAGKVIAVEIDKTLIPILNELLVDYDNIELINEDILKVDINGLVERNNGRPLKIVANLPYYITTPIIMEMLERHLPIESFTVMVQKEVGYRMKAEPSTKEYGSLSLMVRYFCNPYLVANVPQNCFMPRPNVDSAVIKLEVFDKPPVKAENEQLMFEVIKTAFSQRRKTLLNCIFNSTNFDFSKEEIAEILVQAGFDDKVRGETLSLEDYARLSDVINERKNNK